MQIQKWSITSKCWLEVSMTFEVESNAHYFGFRILIEKKFMLVMMSISVEVVATSSKFNNLLISLYITLKNWICCTLFITFLHI